MALKTPQFLLTFCFPQPQCHVVAGRQNPPAIRGEYGAVDTAPMTLEEKRLPNLGNGRKLPAWSCELLELFLGSF
jgi:hypothetical protein